MFTYIISPLLRLFIELLLQSMPLGYNIEKGKEYDDMIGCAVVISVSALYSRHYNLALS